MTLGSQMKKAVKTMMEMTSMAIWDIQMLASHAEIIDAAGNMVKEEACETEDVIKCVNIFPG